MTSSFFSGPERLETFGPLGRAMRLGDAAAANGTDLAAFELALAQRRTADAVAYIDLMVADQLELLAILGEWALQLPRTLETLTDPEAAQAICRTAFARFSEHIPFIALSVEAKAAADAVAAVLDPQSLRADTFAGPDELRASRRLTALDGLLASAAARGQTARAVVTLAAAPETARTAIRAYVDYTRSAHDAWVQFIDSFGATVVHEHGQRVMEDLIQRSFSSCSFFEPLWSAAELPPRELGAFLAAHLRAHFSGAGRGGGVQVHEDEEKVRLVFDACGSGGAMRRRTAGTSRSVTLSDATPATWMRAGEVPPYCSHCAFNELESIRRYGYPKLVTKFDPDPERPCGWTVYKRADVIPDRYYERLGLKKPSP